MKKSIVSLAALAVPMSLSAQLVINELLFDPAANNDVNLDGNANTSEDEFVEIVNTGAATVDLTDYTITDESGNVFTFGFGVTIDPNEAVLVFGGGTPAATVNGAQAFSGAPSLNNGGDIITLADASGVEIDSVAYTGGASDQSWNRDPDLTGEFVAHTSIPGAVGTESPGTDVFGNAFGNPLPSLEVSPLVSTINESGAGNMVTLTVTLPEAPATYPFTLNLASNDETEATVPETVVLNSGLSVSFDVTGIDDTDPDGNREVSITIAGDGFRAATATVTVNDDGDEGTPSTSPLLFTQYYEGSGSNKFVELTNVSDSDVDLSDYTVVLYFNANAESFKADPSSPGNQVTLSGILPAGTSYVIANGGAGDIPLSPGLADLTSEVTFFNGDDSIVLYSGGGLLETANIADALSFTDLGNEGAETSFVRLNNEVGFNLDLGTTILDFPTVWGQVLLSDVDSAARGNDLFLGSSSLGIDTPLVVLGDSSASIGEDGGTVDLTLQIFNPDGAAVSVTLGFDEINSTASLADVANFTPQTVTFPAGAQEGDTQMVTVTVTDDTEAEPAENAIFALSNLVSTGSARIGGSSTFTLNIQDNDTVIPPLYISELADPGDEFNARFIEIFNPTPDEIDLGESNWNLVYYSNANTVGRNIPLIGIIPAGGTYIVASNLEVYELSYPNAPLPNLVDNTYNSNGDDNVELRFGGGFESGAIVDVYGMPGTDGTGMDWEFENSQVVRIAGAPNATYTSSEWVVTPANVAEMTPGVHGGTVIETELTVLGFSIDQENSAAAFTVTGAGNRDWVVETSNDLGIIDPWTTLTSAPARQDNEDGTTTFTFSGSFSSGKRFYRLNEGGGL